VAGVRERSRAAFDAVVRGTIADDDLRRWLAGYQVVSKEWHDAALAELGDVEAWRDAVAALRSHTLAHLDGYLDRFAENVEARGGHVRFAATAAEAREHVVAIARRRGARRIVKAKSMVTSEIDLNPALEALGAEVAETDLGEFIVQLSGEPPYHITGPALHKTLPQIRELFSRLAGEELPEDAEALGAFARRTLREKFLAADLGISGANFGIASTGTVVLVTNEGNGRMATTLPRTHIVVMGMERLIPDWPSLETVLTMLTRAGTGERITTYVSAITGPRREGDVDGPEELHVVIVDNGRSRILGSRYRPVLNCIRCGFCADVCPVYRTMGGYAYESVYTGPIGAVLAPLLDGLEGREHLPYASTLCGACQADCPARVPLADLLLELRADVVESGRGPSSWGAGFKAFAALSSRPRLWDFALAAAGRLAPLAVRDGRPRLVGSGATVRPAVADAATARSGGDDGAAAAGRTNRYRDGLGTVRAWSDSRDLPAPAVHSFRRLWARRPWREAARLEPAAASAPPGVATPAAAPAPPAAPQRAADDAALFADAPGFPSPPVPGLPEPDDREALSRLFTERLNELGGTVTSAATRTRALEDVAAALRDGGDLTLACPSDLRWAAVADRWTDDPRLAGFGLSKAQWGVALSGTLVLLHGGPHARGFSLIPPAVGFLLPASRLVPRLGPVVAEIQALDVPPACVTLVSGPSHSTDIAGVPCVGVHGPADVRVWLIADE
jgi:L-lactate dehydrogenase complex protein LldF